MIQHHKRSWRELEGAGPLATPLSLVQPQVPVPGLGRCTCCLRTPSQVPTTAWVGLTHLPVPFPITCRPSTAGTASSNSVPKGGSGGCCCPHEHELQRLGTTGESPLRVTWALCAPTNLFHSLPLSLSLPPAPAPPLSHCPPASFREGTGSPKEHFKHRCLGFTQTHCNQTTRERGSDIWAFHYSPGNSNVQGDSQAVPFFAQFSLILQKFLIAFGMWVTMFPIFQCWQGFFSYYYIEINSDLSAIQGRLS